MNAPTYTKTGSKSSSSTKLNAEVFGLEVKNTDLLKQVYESTRSNARKSLASTKTRSNVRGGGRKPWRQKGTGRARAGSIRSPIWRGGGIIFGPSTNRSSKKVNKKAKRAAVKQALSLASKSNQVAVIEDFKPTGKTKEAAEILNKIDAPKPLLVVVDEVDEKISRSVNNLSRVEVSAVNTLNANQILDSSLVLFTKKSLEHLDQRLEAKNG